MKGVSSLRILTRVCVVIVARLVVACGPVSEKPVRVMSCPSTCEHLTTDGTNLYVSSFASLELDRMILQAPKVGGDAVTFAGVPSPTFAVDMTYAYWVDGIGRGTYRDVLREPLSGGVSVTLGQAPNRETAAIAADAQAVVWDGYFGITGITADGQAISYPDRHPSVLALNGRDVFWQSGNSIVRGSGGQISLVAGYEAYSPLVQMAFDERNVYWNDVRLYSAPLEGGQTSTLWDPGEQSRLTAIASRGDRIFACRAGGVVSISKAKGALEEIVPYDKGALGCGEIIADDAAIYYTWGKEVRRLRVP